MAQASKRRRNQRNFIGNSTTYDYRAAVRQLEQETPADAIEGERVWINRKVYGLSHSDLEASVSLFDPSEARAKIGRYSLSVVIPGEVFLAISDSRRNSISPAVITKRLFQGFPDSAKKPVTAEVQELGQFGKWVSLHAPYDSFDTERKFISEYLSDALGIDHEWRATPHVSLAKGFMTSISNLDEVQESLPRYIQLGEITEN